MEIIERNAEILREMRAFQSKMERSFFEMHLERITARGLLIVSVVIIVFSLILGFTT